MRSAILWLGIVMCAGAPSTAAPPSPPGDVEFFEKEIRPILVERCQSCHGEKKQQGGLRLTSREAAMKGGDRGPALVPGKPGASKLLQVVEYAGKLKMPPTGKLPDAEIARLKQWITQGAVWPDAAKSTDTEAKVSEEQRRWWAFQPVRSAPPPRVKSDGWSRSPIDLFVLAELEKRGLAPALDAERRVLLRRATLDLTGLPPTVQELEAFLADKSSDAFARVVDRLLASPAYGERWARHWLDVVRYADYHDGIPQARTASCEPLEAWRYRDWVVASFNRDLPFDRFIVHQIAGDLLRAPDGNEFYADGLIATTFLTNGSWDRGDADKEKMVSDMVDDQIDTIGKAFLGLTLGCARCHDHKFDPISQTDYYALAGIFYSTHILKDIGTKGGEYTVNRIPLAPKSYLTKRDRQLAAIEAVKAKLAGLDKKSPKAAGDEADRVSLVKQRDALQADLLAAPPVAEAAQEGGTVGGLFPKIQDVPVHIRGSYTRLGAMVPRRMPQFLAGSTQPAITKGSGRKELAAWIASTDNPLTARVIVNRVWQGHFGSGLVATPNNYGLRSDPPSHPELLDWLAARFVEDGWSLKKLHRRIVLSSTYQQSSVIEREVLAKDPENRWLGRFTPRRLEAESIRDSLLAAAGRLDRSMGGPAFADMKVNRRSLYLQTARWDRSNFATLFDAANPDTSEEKRNVSTVAPQSLFVLNHEFVLKQAGEFADRLARDVPDDEHARIHRAFQLLFARPATIDEIRIAKRILDEAGKATAWRDLAHVLLCSNELIYLD